MRCRLKQRLEVRMTEEVTLGVNQSLANSY